MRTKKLGLTGLFSIALIGAALLLAPTVLAQAGQNLISNFDFSQGASDDGVPTGWIRFAAHPIENAYFELSDEEASVGKYSLKIVDDSSSFGAGIRTEYFPAKPGERFRLEADILSLSGLPTIWLDFRSADDARVQSFKVTIEPDVSRWQRIVIEETAPEGTATVSVILYSENARRALAYYDNVQLYKVE